jgi:hypothetical protein
VKPKEMIPQELRPDVWQIREPTLGVLMRSCRRTPTTEDASEFAIAGERVEGWVPAGAAGANRAEVDGELTGEAMGTAMVADCETTTNAEDVDNRRVAAGFSVGHTEGKDWTESDVGMDGAVDAEGICVPGSGPIFLESFAQIRL